VDSHFRAPTHVVISDDIAVTVPAIVHSLNGHRVALMVDRNVKALAQVDQLVSAIESMKLEAFEIRWVEAREPEVGTVDEAVGDLGSLMPDLVIGLGGGSVIDLAKAASVLLYNSGRAADYQGAGLIKKPGARKVMIPTTAGTGAEVTPGAVVLNPETKRKGAISSPFVFPDFAVLEPSLTVTMPLAVTAATGMDALAHSLEAYVGRADNPFAKACAREAYRMISESLPLALGDPSDLGHRRQMLAGSTLAGFAIYNLDTGAAHSMAYALGTYFSVPHSVAVALLLPHVVAHNVAGGATAFADLGPADDVVAGVRAIAPNGLLPKLSDFGVTTKDVPWLAEKGLKLKTALDNNPVPFEQKDAERVLATLLDT
jgi:alcohol dehydrogenase class IV